MVSFKYLTNFWRTLEMLFINCEINLILNWSATCVVSNTATGQVTAFAITYAKHCVPVVTLSTQDNEKLLEQLKSGFKHTIIWNKYHSETEPLNAPNPNLDFREFFRE